MYARVMHAYAPWLGLACLRFKNISTSHLRRERLHARNGHYGLGRINGKLTWIPDLALENIHILFPRMQQISSC
jgi:hypothetical protein